MTAARRVIANVLDAIALLALVARERVLSTASARGAARSRGAHPCVRCGRYSSEHLCGECTLVVYLREGADA